MMAFAESADELGTNLVVGGDLDGLCSMNRCQAKD